MKFYGREEEVRMEDIQDELELKLNYAFWYAIGNEGNKKKYHNEIN